MLGDFIGCYTDVAGLEETRCMFSEGYSTCYTQYDRGGYCPEQLVTGVNIVLQRGGWRGAAALLWTACVWGRSWGRGAASSPATSTPPRVSAGGDI